MNHNKKGFEWMSLLLLTTLLIAGFAIGPGTSLATTAQAGGKAIFESKCSACHGKDGSGNTPVGKNLKIKDLRSAEVQHMSNAQLAKVIADGKGKMPAYGKSLDGQKINEVVAYIRTLAH